MRAMPLITGLLLAGAATPAAAQLAAIDLRATEVVRGVTGVVDLAVARDGSNRLYLVRQAGEVRVLEGGSVRSAPFLDVRDRVGTGGSEEGLLSLAFSPSYPSSRRLYVWYTDPQGRVVLSRFTARADGSSVDPATEQVLLRIPHPNSNHNGGKLAFGPDGMLYVSIGDGGGAGDPNNVAQDRSQLLGKLLRLDVESGEGYAIPPGNPFLAEPGARPEIWAYGLRNPWKIAFDRASNELYIADVGQNQREEVNVQPAAMGGQNYGWRLFEGTRPFNGGSDTTGLTMPVAEYDHSLGCSITGGYVYRGSAHPGLIGTYLYGDFCTGRIFGLRRENNRFVSRELIDTPYGITTFGEDETGQLYVYDGFGSVLYRLSDGPPAASGVAIGPAFTGSWFDPAQSGHGMLLEVLPNQRMVAAWYTFRPEGGQAWIFGTGPILGDTAVIDALIPEGGRFIPNFDPAQVTNRPWGTLTIRFTDCNNGRVDYSSTAGFGNGSMRLTRLTLPSGLRCP